MRLVLERMMEHSEVCITSQLLQEGQSTLRPPQNKCHPASAPIAGLRPLRWGPGLYRLGRWKLSRPMETLHPCRCRATKSPLPSRSRRSPRSWSRVVDRLATQTHLKPSARACMCLERSVERMRAIRTCRTPTAGGRRPSSRKPLKFSRSCGAQNC